MTIHQYMIAKLTEIMWHGSRTEPEAIAIGCALRNRVQDGLGSWHQIFAQESPEHRRELPDLRDPEFLRYLNTAEDIFCGRKADVTSGARFWRGTMIPGRIPKATVNALYLYTEPN